jgi:hypothetical protein
MPEDVARPLSRRRAEATALPAWIKPQLTRLVDGPPDGAEWLHEIKFDGYRMHARLDRGFESCFLQRGVGLCSELGGCRRKTSRFCASLHGKRDERGGRAG